MTDVTTLFFVDMDPAIGAPCGSKPPPVAPVNHALRSVAGLLNDRARASAAHAVAQGFAFGRARLGLYGIWDEAMELVAPRDAECNGSAAVFLEGVAAYLPPRGQFDVPTAGGIDLGAAVRLAVVSQADPFRAHAPPPRRTVIHAVVIAARTAPPDTSGIAAAIIPEGSCVVLDYITVGGTSALPFDVEALSVPPGLTLRHAVVPGGSGLGNTVVEAVSSPASPLSLQHRLMKLSAAPVLSPTTRSATATPPAPVVVAAPIVGTCVLPPPVPAAAPPAVPPAAEAAPHDEEATLAGIRSTPGTLRAAEAVAVPQPGPKTAGDVDDPGAGEGIGEGPGEGTGEGMATLRFDAAALEPTDDTR